MRYAKNTESAQDILQDGYMRIFNGLASYTGSGSFTGWLKRVMVTTAINHYKADRHERAAMRLDDVDPDGSHLQGIDQDQVFSRLSMNELLRIVQDLPPAYRTVFNLRVMDGWTHAEIATELGITVGTSKSNVSRARAILINSLKALDPSLFAQRTDRGH